MVIWIVCHCTWCYSHARQCPLTQTLTSQTLNSKEGLKGCICASSRNGLLGNKGKHTQFCTQQYRNLKIQIHELWSLRTCVLAFAHYPKHLWRNLTDSIPTWKMSKTQNMEFQNLEMHHSWAISSIGNCVNTISNGCNSNFLQREGFKTSSWSMQVCPHQGTSMATTTAFSLSKLCILLLPFFLSSFLIPDAQTIITTVITCSWITTHQPCTSHSWNLLGYANWRGSTYSNFRNQLMQCLFSNMCGSWFPTLPLLRLLTTNLFGVLLDLLPHQWATASSTPSPTSDGAYNLIV